MNQNGLSIGEVAKAAGVHVETVRFYERRGIVAQPKKTHTGMRRYPAGVVTRIQFVKHAQGLGFTLAEIQDLLKLQVDKRNSCAEVQRRAAHKRSAVRAKIKALTALERTLTRMMNACANGTALDPACPILLVLESRSGELKGNLLERKPRTGRVLKKTATVQSGK